LPQSPLAYAHQRPAVRSPFKPTHPQGQIQHVRPALAGVACWAVVNPLRTAGAQSGPRLACALHVWEIMQVKDCGQVAAPRASTGRARPIRSFL